MSSYWSPLWQGSWRSLLTAIGSWAVACIRRCVATLFRRESGAGDSRLGAVLERRGHRSVDGMRFSTSTLFEHEYRGRRSNGDVMVQLLCSHTHHAPRFLHLDVARVTRVLDAALIIRISDESSRGIISYDVTGFMNERVVSFCGSETYMDVITASDVARLWVTSEMRKRSKGWIKWVRTRTDVYDPLPSTTRVELICTLGDLRHMKFVDAQQVAW
jgi:hypothetical protein